MRGMRTSERVWNQPSQLRCHNLAWPRGLVSPWRCVVYVVWCWCCVVCGVVVCILWRVTACNAIPMFGFIPHLPPSSPSPLSPPPFPSRASLDAPAFFLPSPPSLLASFPLSSSSPPPTTAHAMVCVLVCWNCLCCASLAGEHYDIAMLCPSWDCPSSPRLCCSAPLQTRQHCGNMSIPCFGNVTTPFEKLAW